MKQEMMGWQRHKLDHMQIICTSLQTDIGDDGGELLISPDGVAPSRLVGVSASVIFLNTIKTRRRFLLAQAHSGSPGKKGRKTVV